MYFKCLSALTVSILMLASCSENNGQATKGVGNDSVTAFKTNDSLRNKIAEYVAKKQLNIGVAVMHLGHGDTLSVNGHYHFAMMSVCKFPQAITLLHLVDEGKYTHNSKVHITPADLTIPTNSTLQKDHSKAPFDISIPEALAYSIGQSDNITSNVFFDMDGGPEAVEAYIHSLGINEIGVGVDYRHMRNDSLFLNWITPVAAVALLHKFYTSKILTDTSRAILWKALVEAPNGKDRLPGLLPDGTVVGHKTGTSGRDSANVTTAFNDIGIIQLPNRELIAIAVFIEKTALPNEENAKSIAEIGKMVWDFYMGK